MANRPRNGEKIYPITIVVGYGECCFNHNIIPTRLDLELCQRLIANALAMSDEEIDSWNEKANKSWLKEELDRAGLTSKS